MKQDESYNEQELRKMEAELRSYGEPYGSDAPDDRYFANFRMRLMERIDAAEAARKRSVIGSVIEWFTGSVLRGISVGAAVVVIAVIAVTMFRSSDAPTVENPTVAMKEPLVAPETTKSVTTTPAAEEKHKTPVTTQAAKASPRIVTTTPKLPAGDELADAGLDANVSEADVPLLARGTETDPVDLSSLSESELTSVLAAVSSMDDGTPAN